MSPHSQRLPPAIVDVSFKLPRNQTLYAALQPNLTEKRIVPLLIKEELVMTSERGVDLAVLVEIRGDSPSAVVAVEEEHHALANVDEDADLTAAPRHVSM